MSLLISGTMVDSEERLLDRWEEPALFVIDRIIQAYRDSAQRSAHLTSLWLGKTVRASVGHNANDSSQPVMVRADLSPRFRRETAVPLQPGQ